MVQFNRDMGGRVSLEPNKEPGSFAGNVLKGLAGGVARDPLVSLLARAVASEEDIKKAQALGQGSKVGRAASGVGSFATNIIPMMKSYSVGKTVANKSLQMLGRSAGTVGKIQSPTFKGGEGAVKGVAEKWAAAGPGARWQERLGTAGVLSEVRSSGAIKPGQTIKQALDDKTLDQPTFDKLLSLGLGTKKGETAVDIFRPGQITAFERVFEIGGANLGMGVFEFAHGAAEALIEGEDYDEAAADAALITLLGMGLEGVLFTATRIPKFNVDLGLTKLMPIEMQQRIGAADDFGRNVVKERFGGFKNPLHRAPEINTTQRKRAQRQLRQSAKGVEVRKSGRFDVDEAGEPLKRGTPIMVSDMDKQTTNNLHNFHLKMNDLLGLTGKLAVLKVADPTKPSLLGNEMSWAQFRKIRTTEDFFNLTNTKIFGRKTAKVYGKREKTLDQLATIIDRTRRDKAKYKKIQSLDPRAQYFDVAPSITGDLEADLLRKALKIIITPEGSAQRLGAGFMSVYKGILEPLDQKETQFKDLISVVGRDLSLPMAEALGFKAKHANTSKAVASIAKAFQHHEVNGALGADAVVAAMMKDVKHKSGRLVNEEEARTLHGAFDQMLDVMNNGYKNQLASMQSGEMLAAAGLHGFDTLHLEAPDVYRQLKRGGLAKLAGPNAIYFPHLLLEVESSAGHLAMLQKTMPKKEFKALIAGRNMDMQRDALPMHSSLDYQRAATGSLQDKIARGWQMNGNIIEVFEKYMFQVNRRVNTGREFGYTQQEQKEFTRVIKSLVAQEQAYQPEALRKQINAIKAAYLANEGKPIKLNRGGDTKKPNIAAAQIAGDLINIATGKSWELMAERRMANILTSFQVITKLPLAVWANATQQGQNFMFNGWQATVKSVRDNIVSKEKPKTIATAAGIVEALTIDTAAFKARPHVGSGFGTKVANSMQYASDFVLQRKLFWPFSFAGVERWNRRIGAGASYHRATELVIKASGMTQVGKRGLIGKQLDYGRRQANSMGFDLDEVARKVRKAGTKEGPNGEEVLRFFDTPEGVEWMQTVMFQGAKRTQFIVTPLSKPTYWSHPTGRVLFQFKTFALQQYKFMRDSVLREASLGNMAPLVTYLGITPVTGELAGDIKSFIKDGQIDRGENGIARILQNMMYTGGLGIVTDLAQSAQYEQLAEAMMGPTLSDWVSYGEYIARRDAGGFAKDMTNDPLFRVGKFYWRTMLQGAGFTTEMMDEYFETTSEVGNFGATGRTFSAGVPARKQTPIIPTGNVPPGTFK